jgi:hypothetical protein
MDPPNSANLKDLATAVKTDLGSLSANLRENPYKDNAVESLYPSVSTLDDMLQKELERDPYYTSMKAVRDALSSLRSVEGSIQLLITASSEYATSRNLAEKHEIQDTWMDRKIRLLDQADLCAASLDVVLAFADHLDSLTSTSEPAGGAEVDSSPPASTTARKRRGRAS